MGGMRTVFLVLLLGGGCLAATPASADMRCEYGLISRGLTPWEVRQRCGEAVYTDRRIEHRPPGYYVEVDEWIYDQGETRFQRLLRFENGRLRRIELLGKPRGMSPLL
jgi:hypothetical protein